MSAAACRLRYELAVASSSDKATGRLLFRLSRCKRAYPHDMLDIVGVPLPESHKEVLFDGCPWESFLVRPRTLPVACLPASKQSRILDAERGSGSRVVCVSCLWRIVASLRVAQPPESCRPRRQAAHVCAVGHDKPRGAAARG